MSQGQAFSLELFPLDPRKRPDIRTLDTGEKYIKQERILRSSIFSVQPTCEGPLSALRAVAVSLLMQETGVNVGYGFDHWRDHTLNEWFQRPVDEWVFGHNLAWEVTIGCTLWIALITGAPSALVKEWQSKFVKEAHSEAHYGDFFSLTNDGKPKNIPTLDALIRFFRDMLLNRLLEHIPATNKLFRDSLDPEVVRKMREWTLPPRNLWRYCLDAETKDLRTQLRELTSIRDETGCTTPVYVIVWQPARSMSHFELVDVARLPTYYFGQAFVPPLDYDEIDMDAIQIYLPSSIEGPTNGIRPPESYADFMEKYYRRLHIVEVDPTVHISLFHLLPFVASSKTQQKKDQYRLDALREQRKASLSMLHDRIEGLVPATTKQANLKAIVGQWFADVE